jgi:hypothetical protein
MNILKRNLLKSNSKYPEDYFTVIINKDFVRIEHPHRKTEQIFWKDINEIKLINTDEGPLLPDVWLALLGENSGCVIPQGARGFDNVYEIISKYDNFNFENVIKCMSCTDNEHFILWTRK